MVVPRTKIPDYVIIYGKEIPVEFKDNLKDSKGNEIDGDTDGHKIYIHAKAKKKDHLGILLHEMWHCIMRRTGVYYREDHDEQLEEMQAEFYQTTIQENWSLRSRN